MLWAFLYSRDVTSESFLVSPIPRLSVDMFKKLKTLVEILNAFKYVLCISEYRTGPVFKWSILVGTGHPNTGPKTMDIENMAIQMGWAKEGQSFVLKM
jgi:hypothetical protein